VYIKDRIVFIIYIIKFTIIRNW